MDIFRVLDPLYSRICTTDDGCLLPIVSEQTLYKTRVDALCTCTYVAILRVHIGFSQRVNDQQVSILLRICLPDT